MPLIRMKAEKSTPMAVSPTWKACLIWSLSPRMMYWSRASMNRVKPMTHIGQSVIDIVRWLRPPAPTVVTCALPLPGPCAGGPIRNWRPA